MITSLKKILSALLKDEETKSGDTSTSACSCCSFQHKQALFIVKVLALCFVHCNILTSPSELPPPPGGGRGANFLLDAAHIDRNDPTIV